MRACEGARGWARAVALVAVGCGAQVQAQEAGSAPSSQEAGPALGQEAGFRLVPSAQVFGGYEVVLGEGDSFQQFRLDRAELGVGALLSSGFGGEVRAEAIRSAGPGSILGVDGDSLVFRLRRGWAFGQLERPWVRAQARVGLIPEPWLDSLAPLYDLPELSVTLAERGRFLEPSDLGAELVTSWLDGAVEGRVALTNGEGLRQTEQNAGKNLTGLLGVDPLRLAGVSPRYGLAVRLMYRDGSQGLGSARDHRGAAALVLRVPRLQLGVEGVLALGLAERSEREAVGVGAWGSALVWEDWLGVAGRYDFLDLDADQPEATQQLVTAGVFVEGVPTGLDPRASRARLTLAVQDERLGADASPIPGLTGLADNTRIMLLLSLGVGAPTLTPDDGAEPPKHRGTP